MTRIKAIVLSICLGAALMASPFAFARSEPTTSNPEDGSTVDAAPEEVVVKFGNPNVPSEDQPFSITDGRLEVYDACGKKVSGETLMNDNMNELRTSSGGSNPGRYELHWYVSATDMEKRSGVIEYFVENGARCKAVVRSDPKDADAGFDVVAVRAKLSDDAHIITATVALAKSTGCSAFSKGAKDVLELPMDTDGDGQDDLTGRFTCKRGRASLLIERDEKTIRMPARLNRRGNKVTAQLIVESFGAGPSLALYASAASERERCSGEAPGAEDPPVCSDRAPDMGVLRSL